MKLIAETAWHHDGDFPFFQDLVEHLCRTRADFIKIHLLADLDAYMLPDHPAYGFLKDRVFQQDRWRAVMDRIRSGGKGLMTLLNDTGAAKLAAEFRPELVEIHSVALNDRVLIESIKDQFDRSTRVILGVGGSTLYEIENAARQFEGFPVVLMFGFQNYPTRYQDINLRKIRRVMDAFPEFEYGYADHTAWNEPRNVLITLLGAAQGMSYVEKHVTTRPGEERTDYSAAITEAMLDEIKAGLDLLSACEGDGLLALNPAEQKYCVPGIMKKTAVAARDLPAGRTLAWDDIRFVRTGQSSDLQQLEAWDRIGQALTGPVPSGQALTSAHFAGAAK